MEIYSAVWTLWLCSVASVFRNLVIGGEVMKKLEKDWNCDNTDIRTKKEVICEIVVRGISVAIFLGLAFFRP